MIGTFVLVEWLNTQYWWKQLRTTSSRSNDDDTDDDDDAINTSTSDEFDAKIMHSFNMTFASAFGVWAWLQGFGPGLNHTNPHHSAAEHLHRLLCHGLHRVAHP